MFKCSLIGLLLSPVAFLLMAASSARADDKENKLVLPKGMTAIEKTDLSALRKVTHDLHVAIDKKEADFVKYFVDDYPSERSSLPLQLNIPGGTKLQPAGGGREIQLSKVEIERRKAIHAEVHKELKPLVKESKLELDAKLKESVENGKKSKADQDKIKDEHAKKFLSKTLPTCEKHANDDYKKDMKNLKDKLAQADKLLIAKKEAIIKAHAGDKSK